MSRESTMNDSRRRAALLLGSGIAIGLILGLVVKGHVAALAATWWQRVAKTSLASTPDQGPRPDPNVVTMDEPQAQGLKIEPVRLRSFRQERTTVGRIAFNEDRTTSIFAPFQGRIVRLNAKPGDVLQPGQPAPGRRLA